MQNQKDPYHHLSSEEIFHRVAIHLFAQGEPARAKDSEGGTSNVCLYRGPKGPNGPLKCAVGFLIPDSAYKEEMEGHGLSALLNEFGESLPESFWTYKELLSSLQTIHDGYSPSSAVPFDAYLLGHLSELAGKHNYDADLIRRYYTLSITNPEELKEML